MNKIEQNDLKAGVSDLNQALELNPNMFDGYVASSTNTLPFGFTTRNISWRAFCLSSIFRKQNPEIIPSKKLSGIGRLSASAFWNRGLLLTPNFNAFVLATGGTESTCGNCKIHTFTGPGTFCVSAVGNPLGSNTVDYFVVAGGGGVVSGGGQTLIEI